MQTVALYCGYTLNEAEKGYGIMENILFVNACFRHGSRTLRLAKLVLQRFAGQMEEVDLGKEAIEPLNAETLAMREALVKAGDYTHPMFRYAR